jgi:hypothetical protein
MSNHHPRCGYVGMPDDPQPSCTCGGNYIPPKKWMVVVGQPKLEMFSSAYPPDMDNVGKPMQSSRYSSFATEAEAQAEADAESKCNEFWNFETKEVI